jgi:hypothetical protein
MRYVRTSSISTSLGFALDCDCRSRLSISHVLSAGTWDLAADHLVGWACPIDDQGALSHQNRVAEQIFWHAGTKTMSRYRFQGLRWKSTFISRTVTSVSTRDLHSVE